MQERRRRGSRGRLWSYTAGKYGFRVRAFERRGRPSLTLAYWDPLAGTTRKRSLGHADRSRAKGEAEELAQCLRRAAASVPSDAAPDRAATGRDPQVQLTVEDLFTQYEARAVSHLRRPDEARRRLAIWRHFLTAERVIRVVELDDTHIAAFAAQRRHGDLQVEIERADGTTVPMKLRPPAPKAIGQERRAAVVSERTIGADVEFLLVVLNWGTQRKVKGVPLVAQNPLTRRKFQTPTAQRRRPVATEEDHRALVRVADRVDPQALLGCCLRLLDDLGWRITGLCHLRGSDVDFSPGYGRPYGAIRKNPLVDKERVDDWVPLSRHARATIGRLLRRRGLVPGAFEYLFPAPRAANQPWSRYHVRDLVVRAETAAGIQHVGGAHAWRRKWATERKAHPEADLMRAGAWRDARSLREAYTQPDAASTYAVVSRRTGAVRRVAASDRFTTT